jgi:hypothetical protein
MASLPCKIYHAVSIAQPIFDCKQKIEIVPQTNRPVFGALRRLVFSREKNLQIPNHFPAGEEQNAGIPPFSPISSRFRE